MRDETVSTLRELLARNGFVAADEEAVELV